MSKRIGSLGVIVALLAALALTGCSPDDAADGTGAYDVTGGACFAPLACGPYYPAPIYPYMAHPFYGYFSPYASHVHITIVNGRPQPIYRPYSPPILPGYRPPPARVVSPPKQAPVPKPPAAKPAPPARAKK